MSTKGDFTIGADPEFCCLENGEIKAAEDYHERNCFGSDGGGIAFEMRPDYSTDPLKVVTNIHRNFLQLVMKDPQFMNFEWRAGSYVEGHSIGGHIHFGNIPKGMTVSNSCEWLDQFVGSCTMLIEDPVEGRSRRGSQSGYGHKGDHRTNDHGFEYRTASSWLTSPYVAAAVLSLAKATMHEGIRQGRKAPPKFVSATDINSMRVPFVKKKFPSIWEAITKMELYPEYKPQIDLIHTLVTHGRTWFPKTNMKVSWGVINISNMEQDQPKKITLESIWSGVTNKKEV